MDLLHTFGSASGPTLVVLWLLLGASVAVWVIAIAKARQVMRVLAAQRAFEAELPSVGSTGRIDTFAARHPKAPGARVLLQIVARRGSPSLLEAIGDSSASGENRALSTLLPTLATIGATAPFVGLFGTVWGILEAFVEIGKHKAASLDVVGPAIGEALVATALGLFAAIPAVIAYNFLGRKIGDLTARVRASSRVWAHMLGDRDLGGAP